MFVHISYRLLVKDELISSLNPDDIAELHVANTTNTPHKRLSEFNLQKQDGWRYGNEFAVLHWKDIPLIHIADMQYQHY
jgi:hypothetical protein